MCASTMPTFLRSGLVALAAVVTLWVPAFSALPLRLVPYATGFAAPVAIVQDSTDSHVQFVVQQEGRIRTVVDGAVQAADFLNLQGAISIGGERGLLGLAFPPDAAASGRFYVDFTDLSGNTVVARFQRSSPRTADPASRLDLLWSTGDRFIVQPFSNHNGGCLQFGPDGYLYIGMGDGGGGDDTLNNAQNPASLLGKMLRIDVVHGDSVKGFVVPLDNPFASSSRPEIWAFGMRNPWRFSFDDPAKGGTGALVIGDVGQSAWEEIDYEGTGHGGRNYGWRNREGAHDHLTTLLPAFLPLTDPLFEYDHTVGHSITGGYVYRGSGIPGFTGRYFFGDFVLGRIWSIGVFPDGYGPGRPGMWDLVEHTTELGFSGNVSSFGVDAAGELFVIDYTSGTVFRLTHGPPPPPTNVRIIR